MKKNNKIILHNIIFILHIINDLIMIFNNNIFNKIILIITIIYLSLYYICNIKIK